MFDHDSPLEYRPNPNRLAIDHPVEATADFVAGGWDDAGQRDEFDDLAHVGVFPRASRRKSRRGNQQAPTFRQEGMLPEELYRTYEGQAACRFGCRALLFLDGK